VANAKPSSKVEPADIKKLESKKKSIVTYVDKSILKDNPKLVKAIEKMEAKGWKKITVAANGGIVCG